MDLKIEKSYWLTTKNWVKKNLVPIIIILLLLSWVYKLNQENNSILKSEKTALEKVEYYKLKDGTQVATKRVVEINKEQLENIIDNSPKNVKEVTKKFHEIKGISSTITETKFDSLDIKFKEPAPCTFIRKDTVKEKYISYNYTSTEKGTKLNDLVINDSVTRITGIKRSWIFGKQTYTIDETHSNPHIVVKSATTFEVKEETPWYRSKVALFLYGVGLGTALQR